jgi:hypothetical protein
MQFALIILILGLLVGSPASADNHELVEQTYRTGMSREEIHAVLTYASLLTSASRPKSGWSDASDGGYNAGRAAFHFERTHPEAKVQTCEVYWVGRETSVPLAVGGVWFDYLYFDRQDRLVGFYRRFVD